MDGHDLPEPRALGVATPVAAPDRARVKGHRDHARPLGPEADALAAIDRETLHEAMWRLPEEQRIALTLVDLAGFSTAETAQVMGTPRGTVLSRLHRGRRALALLLDQDVPERKEAR
jgi:RNA polymerase sigma factor (sigma-70 family)